MQPSGILIRLGPSCPCGKRSGLFLDRTDLNSETLGTSNITTLEYCTLIQCVTLGKSPRLSGPQGLDYMIIEFPC